MQNIKYSPKLPLELDDSGNFISNVDILKSIKQNLRMIVLTNPGEKLLNPEFGVGIKKYLFEPNLGKITVTSNTARQNFFSIESFKEKIETDIRAQVNMYTSNITLGEISITIEENIMNIVINYNYKNFIPDILELQIST